MSKVPGIQAEHQIITPRCRGEGASRHHQAWEQATEKLRDAYDLVCSQRADIGECDIHLVLTVDTPRHKAARAASEAKP